MKLSDILVGGDVSSLVDVCSLTKLTGLVIKDVHFELENLFDEGPELLLTSIEFENGFSIEIHGASQGAYASWPDFPVLPNVSKEEFKTIAEEAYCE
jgi:hypothetical protein